MEKSKLKGKILMELDTLISLSCKSSKSLKKYEELHIALLKKYYNAADVNIDYHRHRVKMDIVTDDTFYDPKKVNTHLPILYTNLLFDNLKSFLSSCIDNDEKSIGFYSQLLTSFTGKKLTPSLV
ncbi:hypothetical protein ACFQZJ_01725 [Maribacter chungangensis]|uniref:Uncharacterized protein n=1 Tax=Maribacter chungangensis TaxID=1069117 RepID=A0ABW3AYZ0_9FLAO